MWPYSFVSREEFEARKDVVDKILRSMGCKVVPEAAQEMTMYGKGFTETWRSERPLYQLGDQYVRICEVLFEQKPFIVLEVADSWEEVRKNAMEDAEPFVYDLSDDQMKQEVKYSLGLEEYPREKFSDR